MARQSLAHLRRVLRYLLVAAIFCAAPGAAQADIPGSERQVLLDLYTSTGGAAWTAANGWNGAAGTECSWFGVTCDATGTTVINITLDANHLSGSLPALDGLPNLQVFSVNDNAISGSIPALSGLTALVDFRCENCQLSGAIPPLTGLTHLASLYFDNNQLSGSIPSLSGLTSLSILSAVGNQLSGNIPSLDGLSQLTALWLPGNQLTGSIPSLTGLTNLAFLDLNGNQLSGSIPSLSGLNSLTYLLLDGGNFTGTLPALTGLTSLQQLSVRNGGLVGTFPSLAGLGNLHFVQIGGNQFSGTVPAIPAPTSALQAGQSSLCPNLFTHSSDADWDAATGASPWYTSCVATTSVSVSSSLNPSTSGHAVTFTATVATPSSFAATGSMAFSDGANPLCADAPVTGGVATCTSSALPFGTQTITALYSGDAYNAASTSPGFAQTVDFVGFVPLVPARLLDTRTGANTIDGQFAGIGAQGAHVVLDLGVLGRGGVPTTGVDTIVLNVTATNTTAAGFMTVWPSGSSRPNASNLNFISSQTIPNLVIAKLGSNGKVSLFNSAGSTDIVADVVGYFTTGSDLNSLVPERLLDTRAGFSTIDGQFAAGGALQGHQQLNLTVAGRPNIPASGADTVVLNVTVAGATAAGFITAWPTGGARPLASNLNFVAGNMIPNLVFAQLGTGGDVTLFNSSGSTDLVADIVGWFPATPELTPVAPARLLDTRSGFTTVDGQFAAIGAVQAQTSIDLTVVGRSGVPAYGVGAVILNVTATNPTAAGFITAWPSGSARPLASNLNFTPGLTRPNLVIAKVSADGKVSLFNSAGSTDLVVDVAGWFPPAP